MNMAQRTSPAKSHKKNVPPGISEHDWAITPEPVRKLVRSLLKTKREWEAALKSYVPVLPMWFMLFANNVIIVGLALFLRDKATMQCIYPPQVSAISAAVILLFVIHIVWRNIYYAFIPPNYKQTIKDVIKVGIVTIPLTFLITLFNEIQPWKIPSRLLGFFLLVSMAAGAFLNLSAYSPFYAEAGSSLQGFSIERFDRPPEKLTLGEPLTIMTEEKVFVEAVLLGAAKARCAWSTATGRQIEAESCSTVFSIQPGAQSDILTVLVQPACGTRQASVNLPIVVQP